MSVEVLRDQHNLQSTQQIIDLIGSSKAQSEEALDDLTSAYAVVTADGDIFKGNKRFAKYYGVSHELVLGKKIGEIFKSQNWEAFCSAVAQLKQNPGVAAEFRTDLVSVENQRLKYHWYLSPLKTKRTDLPALYVLIGHDITQLLETTQKNTRMESELQTAREIQATLLPKSQASFGKSLLTGYYESASECGGDWWHYGMIGDRLFLWIGDVTGHGVGAALLTSAVFSIVNFIESSQVTPGEAIHTINSHIAARYKNSKNMTLFVLSLDLKTGDFSYCSAAHPSAVLISAQQNDDSRDAQRSMPFVPSSPIGADVSSQYEEMHGKLSPGDRLLLWTDGLKDIINADGKRINASGVFFKKIFPKATNAFRGTTDLQNEIVRIIGDFRKDTPLDDDVTFMIFQFNP